MKFVVIALVVLGIVGGVWYLTHHQEEETAGMMHENTLQPSPSPTAMMDVKASVSGDGMMHK